MRISLVITTYRWEDALAVSLESVLRQRVLPHEIIVADDGSGPETAEIVQQFAARSPVPVHHVWQDDEGFRLAKIRNRAIAQSNGDYLIFIDGDTILHEAFIADHRSIAEEGWFVHVKRASLKANPTQRVFAGELKNLHWWSGLRRRRRGIRWPSLARMKASRKQNIRGIMGCNLAFWRDDALAVNGFNEDFQGWGREDNEFAVRMMNHGARRKTYANIAIAFHLYHAPASREQLEENDRILQQTIDGQLERCEHGVSQYAVREVPPQLPTTLRAAEVCHLNIAKGFRGGERQTELLVRGLADRGLSQRAVVRAQQPLAERLIGLPGVDVREVGGDRVGALFATRHVALIHVHQGRAGIIAWVRKLLSRTPYLLTRRVAKLQNTKMGHVYRDADLIVAISRSVAEGIQIYGDTVQADVIPDARADLPVDPDRIEALRQNYADKFVIGHVGALDTSHKGQLHIIAAARQLENTHPKLHFILVGDGKDREMLEREAEGLKNLSFVGFVDHVADYLEVLDLFIYPSLHEGLGSVLLDAMHHGLPIVASRVGGIPEVVEDEQTGLLIPPGDPDRLRSAILRLYDDPQLRARFSEAARHAARAFDPEHMVAAYLQIYPRVLQRR